MALSITTNIADGAALSRVNDGTTIIERATVIAIVKGLSSVTTAPFALSAALTFTQQQYPLGFRYPGGIRAVVTGWAPIGFSASDDSARISITFDSITIPFSQGTFVVSDTCSTENDTSQFFRNDVTGEITQYVMTYTAPKAVVPAANVGQALANFAAAAAAPAITKQYTATLSYPKTTRRVVLQTSFLKGNLTKFRQAVDCTNDAPWNGLPAFFWLLKLFEDSTRDLGTTYECSFQASADIHRDVSQYSGLRDRNTGQLVTVPPNILKAAQALKYSSRKAGIIYNQNALLRVGQYEPTSFQNLFGAIAP